MRRPGRQRSRNPESMRIPPQRMGTRGYLRLVASGEWRVARHRHSALLRMPVQKFFLTRNTRKERNKRKGLFYI